MKHGGDKDVKHKLEDFGSFYYPKECVDKTLNKKCKFAIASHGAGGFDEGIINAFGPHASANDIVMVWPTVQRGGWDASGYSGDKFNTKYSI